MFIIFENMKALEFLKDKTFYIATIKNEKPTIRPFGAVTEFEGKLYLVTSKEKEVYKQIANNPNVCICCCDDNRNWVRIEGRAIFDDRTPVKQKMLDDNPVLLARKRYTSVTDPNMVVFYIEDMICENH